jgi:NADH-quinone oxidoreductase subunit J
MVLFLFVVMLLNVPREEAVAGRLGPTTLRVGAVLSLLLGAEVLWALSRVGSAWFRTDTAETVSSVTNIGQTLFTQYAFAFEVTSILILVAMVGAVVVARRES